MASEILKCSFINLCELYIAIATRGVPIQLVLKPLCSIPHLPDDALHKS